MKFKRIVLAGGNGYLGRILADHYKDQTEEIIIFSRAAKPQHDNVKTIVWDAKTKGDWINYIDGADMLINLCGKNVNCRYTEKNQKEIFASRLVPTKLLGDAIATAQHPPKVWINITSATIHRHAEDRPQDEYTGEIGEGFSVEVCKQWEQTFFDCDTPGTRKVALRTSFVLSMSDSAFPRLVNLAKFGLGGRQGNGEQYVSWIHEQDLARITEWVIDHDLEGAFNCTAPCPIKNRDFMQLIRKAYRMPLGLPMPEWLFKIAAFVIGTEPELVLKSRWVVPAKLLENGFQFKYGQPEHAINTLINNAD